MLHPARLLTFVVALVLALGVRHFVRTSSADEASVTPASAASRHNTPITQELTDRWKMLPGVLDAHAGYTAGDDFGVVMAYAVCAHCSRRDLMHKLVGDIWRSELEHVTSFKVSAAWEAHRDRPISETWVPQRDAAKLYDRYGTGMVEPSSGGR